MRKIIGLFFILLAVISCKKADLSGNTSTGEGLVPFSLKAPASGTNLVLNSAVPNQTVVITWNPSKPGLETPPVYRWIAALKSVGNFESPVVSILADNGGKDTKLTLTYKQIDDALKAAGVADGAKSDFIWTIEADNGSTKLKSQNIFNISITRFGSGATPFSILGPSSTTSIVTINPGSTTDSIKFNWTRSFPATGGSAIRYKVFFYKDDASTTPLFSINSKNGGVDTLLSISYKDFSDSLTKYGFANAAEVANLRWNVAATSGTWTQMSDFSNQFYLAREVKMYLVGSATPGDWDISKSTRMIEDTRNAGTFYIYLFLKTGELKFVNGQQWPPAAGAVDYGQKKASSAGTLTESDEDNVPVATAGVYRVIVDTKNMKWYLQTATANGIGGMGMIGNFQGWSQPAVKMDYITVNRFNYLANMNTNDEFKFHDGNEWDNSAPNKSRWFGLNGTKLAEDPGNYNSLKYTGASGLVRAIWDATDVQNMRYTLIPGKLYAIGGDANLGNWNNSPGNATMPEFTYLGNGKWTATITVSSGAPFKLVVEKGNWDIQWGAGTTAGTMQHRYYDADPSTFNFPSAGTYTVVVDEYAGTISW